MGKITDSNYRQCRMEKPLRNGGTLTTTSWIPVKHAKSGQYVKLRDGKDGEWIDGWKVVSVGSKEIDGKTALSRSRKHLEHRNATDI